MKKEDKALVIENIANTLKEYNGFYLVETAGLDAEKTSALRRACFGADIKLLVVKNTLSFTKRWRAWTATSPSCTPPSKVPPQ